MGIATNALLLLLPITLAHQVVYQYLPGSYYVPVPIVQYPVQVQGIGQTHGNRKHELISAATYHGCQDATASWQEDEASSSGNIRIKRPAPSARANTNWQVDLIWSHPMASLTVYNGIAYSTSDRSFRIEPTAWTSRTGIEEETVNFSFRANYLPGMARPGLTAIVVDGVYHNCKPGPTRSKQEASTKGVRMAPHPKWPSKIVGLYILLADDSEDGYDSNSDWQPELFEWQRTASNVLFFTFIHPTTMEVPPSFEKLAASRNTGLPGSVPKDTIIMFAIGGYSYSIKPNPWEWLTTKEKAEAMAAKVAKWPEQYGCDGIDLDLEEGAGSRPEAGANMIHFIRRLKELSPNMIVSQPVYGYPQVKAESEVINASWDTKGNSNNLADSIGLMVYEGTQALNYVKNYAKGADQWEGFPIKVNAPKGTILLGAKGSSSSSTIKKLANAAVQDDLLGIMVWYASVKNGFDYAPNWDATTKPDSISGYQQAMDLFNQEMKKAKVVQGADAGVEVSDSESAVLLS